MANLSNYTEGLIATWLAGGAMSTLPTTLYLDLYTTMPNMETGLSGTSICNTLIGSVRKTLNNTSNTIFYASTNTVKNNEILIVNSALATVNNIIGFAIWTQATGGEMLYSGLLTTSVNVSAGESVRFAPNAMILTIE
jgi:hypothetical protein